MTTENFTLLPPNATKLERAMERAMRPGADALACVKLVGTAKEVLPDGWPMFLVWEYGLEELLPYLPDPRVIIVTGLQWQRLQGTPASMRMALAWLGLDAQIYQEDPDSAHWYEYQIDPGTVPTRKQMEDIAGLANLSAPVGTRLSRLFHGYDMRRAFWDGTAWDDGSLWSDNSGIYDPDLDIDLSFGRDIETGVELGAVPTVTSVDLEVTTAAVYADKLVWDFSVWGGGGPMLNYPAAIDIEYLSLAGPYAAVVAQPDGTLSLTAKQAEMWGWGPVPWGARKWGEPVPV